MPILRLHSLWTAPNSSDLAHSFGFLEQEWKNCLKLSHLNEVVVWGLKFSVKIVKKNIFDIKFIRIASFTFCKPFIQRIGLTFFLSFFNFFHLVVLFNFFGLLSILQIWKSFNLYHFLHYFQLPIDLFHLYPR